MLRLHLQCLVRGLRLYLAAWGRAFTPAGREQSPLTLKRWLVLFLGFPSFLALQLLHGLAHGIDLLLFPGFRKVAIRQPLMVTGLPRSGTTAVHRLLARDQTTFTAPATWEVLLAPAIIEKRLFLTLGWLDRLVGRPFGRLIDAAIRKTGGTFATIHPTGLQEPEEDYLTLLPAGGCFLAVLAFPAEDALWRLARLDTAPAGERQLVVEAYLLLMRKHLHVFGRDRRLLSKNAAFASWLPALREALPDSRWLLCIRQPGAALSSQLSAVAGGARALGTDPRHPAFVNRFQATFGHALEAIEEASRDRAACVVVDQADLRAGATAVLAAALERLGEQLPAGFGESVGEGREPHRSNHHHRPEDWGLAEDRLLPLTRRYETLRLRAVAP